MANYLLDTNHASVLMAGGEPIRSRVEKARQTGDLFGISPPALGELYYAVYASRRQQQNRANLQGLIESLLIWPFDIGVAEEFGRLNAELRARGRPIPSIDVQIAAVARLYGLTLLTADSHFQFVDNLSVENWLQPN